MSSPYDLHAQAVEQDLIAMGLPCAYWDYGLLFDQSKIIFNLTNANTSCFLTTYHGTKIDLNKVKAIWLRRPGKIKPANFTAVKPWVKTMMEWESSRGLANIFRLMPGLWVNEPAKQEEALLKIQQLGIARAVGLNVPETLVTSDAEAVVAFWHQCQGKVVYKLIDERSQQHIPMHEVPRGIPTLILTPEYLLHIKQVSSSLHLFQRLIDKVCDIRLTIIGQELFAATITLPEYRQNVDWRIAKDVQYQEHVIPEDLASKCLALMSKMGLNFGALDLCLDKEGQYYFLELNPAGQFLWLQKLLNLPLSYTLAKLLAGTIKPAELEYNLSFC